MKKTEIFFLGVRKTELVNLLDRYTVHTKSPSNVGGPIAWGIATPQNVGIYGNLTRTTKWLVWKGPFWNAISGKQLYLFFTLTERPTGVELVGAWRLSLLQKTIYLIVWVAINIILAVRSVPFVVLIGLNLFMATVVILVFIPFIFRCNKSQQEKVLSFLYEIGDLVRQNNQ